MLGELTNGVASRFGLRLAGTADMSLLKSDPNEIIRLIGSGKLSLSLTRIIFEAFGYDTSLIGDGLMSKLKNNLQTQSVISQPSLQIADNDLALLLEAVRAASSNRRLYIRWPKESLLKVSSLPDATKSSEGRSSTPRDKASNVSDSSTDDVLATLFS